MTSIRRHGLLSTERLVRRAVRDNAQRDAILGTHRADSLILRDGVYIRDQMPMPPSLLKSTLCNDMIPSDWFLDPLGQRVVIGLGLGTATLLGPASIGEEGMQREAPAAPG